MSAGSLLSDLIWNEDFWLPPNITWAEIRPRPGLNSTKIEDLGYPLILAIGVMLLKVTLQVKA